MDMNSNAYAAWCYNQQVFAYNTLCYQQQQEHTKQIELQAAIGRRLAELRAAEAEGIRIKEQYRLEKCHREQTEAAEFGEEFDSLLKEADAARLAYAKEVFNNEKIQELAQCRVYREEDKFERLLEYQQKRTEYRRMSRKQRAAKKIKDRAAANEERQRLKNYTQEVFDKAQLAISLGNGQIHGERGRYNIPRTKRTMGTSFGWNNSPRHNW